MPSTLAVQPKSYTVHRPKSIGPVAAAQLGLHVVPDVYVHELLFEVHALIEVSFI